MRLTIVHGQKTMELSMAYFTCKHGVRHVFSDFNVTDWERACGYRVRPHPACPDGECDARDDSSPSSSPSGQAGWGRSKNCATSKLALRVRINGDRAQYIAMLQTATETTPTTRGHESPSYNRA